MQPARNPAPAIPEPDITMAKSEQKDPRFMTALARGLSVLRAFSPGNKPLGNQEIAEIVGLSKPTVSRITFTLTELGYLAKMEDSGRYALAPGVLSLGYSVLAQMGIRDIARPVMQDLADYANASVYLGVPEGLEMVYVEACRAPASMVIRFGVGSRVPMARTAVGRAYLAALPEAERETLIAALAERHDAEAWPEVERKLRRAMAFWGEHGFTLTIGDFIPESNSAGAVIRGVNGRPAYGLNVGGLRSIVTHERLERDVGPRLLAAARKIEQMARGLSF